MWQRTNTKIGEFRTGLGSFVFFYLFIYTGLSAFAFLADPTPDTEALRWCELFNMALAFSLTFILELSETITGHFFVTAIITLCGML